MGLCYSVLAAGAHCTETQNRMIRLGAQLGSRSRHLAINMALKKSTGKYGAVMFSALGRCPLHRCICTDGQSGGILHRRAT